MKKFTAFLLTLVLAFSLSVTAFAAGTTVNPDTDPKAGTTTVSLNIAPTYTITIPATVNLSRTEDTSGTVTYIQTAEIKASEGLRLLANQNIQVTLESDFKLATNDQAATLDYTVTAGGVTFDKASIGDKVVATFDTSTTAQSQTLTFSADDPQYAGDYSDTVTFTVSVVTASSGN